MDVRATSPDNCPASDGDFSVEQMLVEGDRDVGGLSGVLTAHQPLSASIVLKATLGAHAAAESL